MGRKDMKSNAETGEDKLKPEYRASSLALESTTQELFKNKALLDNLNNKFKRKVKLFEQPDVLNEDNILDDQA
jgi:hypothetical protein